MDQFNVKAAGDSILFEKNNGANRYRANIINEKCKDNLDGQLLLKAIEALGLDIEKDKEEIMDLCQELGISYELLGREEPQVNKEEKNSPLETTKIEIDNGDRGEK